MIFVTGCARSGTSLITRMLQAHGCYLGKDNRVNVLFENVTIRENILKSYLSCIGVDPLGQGTLPDTDNLPALFGLQDRVLECFHGGVPPFAYKDAKLTLCWPVWHQAFPQAKWVLVRRDRTRIVDSCERALFMRKRASRSEWEQWVDEHEKRFERMRNELDLIEVWTDAVIAEPKAFRPVAEHCELDFNRGAVARSIDTRRWHPMVRYPQVHRSSA